MALTRAFCCVPPAPQVLAQLYADYRRYRETVKGKPLSFKRYLKKIGFTDPTARFKGGTMVIDASSRLARSSFRFRRGQ